MTRLSEQKAKVELENAQHQLREALFRIQKHRVEAKMQEDVPNVTEEVAFLLENGRHYLVPRVIEILDRFIEAKVNFAYASSQEGAYAAAVAPDDGTPDYLGDEPPP